MALAEPQPPRAPPDKPGPEDGPMQMLNELNLSLSQKQKLLELRTSLPDMQDLRMQLRQSRRKLKEALDADEKEEIILAKFKENQRLQAMLSEQRFDRVLKIRRLLTSEQRKKFPGRPERLERRPGPPGGGPGGFNMGGPGQRPDDP